MPPGHSSQLALLEQDLAHIAANINAHGDVFAEIAKRENIVAQCYGQVLGDLLARMQQLAASILVLLPERMELPLVVLGRALFEASVTFNYLRWHPARQTEAAILFAYTWLRDMEDYADEPELKRERESVLQRLPEDVVATASSRAQKHPRTWSGKTIKAMAAEGRMRGYERAYSLLSGHAHSSRAGRYVRFVPDAPGVVELRIDFDIPASEVEVLANFARRIIHNGAAFVWSELTGQPLDFSSADPETWKHSL